METSDLISVRTNELSNVDRLGALLIAHGVDLAAASSPSALERGTPVYVDVGADPIETQKRMAQAHVRLLFVVDDGAVIGIIDTVELAERAASLPWPVAPLPRGPVAGMA